MGLWWIAVFFVWTWLPHSSVEAVCPNWCNQRGICADPHINGGHCVCEYGFTGDDCAQRYCPMGFDPEQARSMTNRRTVRLETGHLGGVMQGRLEFTFGGASVVLEADATVMDSALCTYILSGLKSIRQVTCERETVNRDGRFGAYRITLIDFPSFPPYMNNYVYHTGNPPRDAFSCDVTQVDAEQAIGPYCRVTDVVTDGIPAFTECANHGECQRLAGGKCLCQAGYRGAACDDTRDHDDIAVTDHVGPFFAASLVKWQVNRTEHAEFNVWNAQIGPVNVTSLRGDRLLRHRGAMVVENASFSVVQLAADDLA
eukprot:gene13143-9411_t